MYYKIKLIGALLYKQITNKPTQIVYIQEDVYEKQKIIS